MFGGFIHTRKEHVRFHELGCTFSSYLHEFICLFILLFMYLILIVSPQVPKMVLELRIQDLGRNLPEAITPELYIIQKPRLKAVIER